MFKRLENQELANSEQLKRTMQAARDQQKTLLLSGLLAASGGATTLAYNDIVLYGNSKLPKWNLAFSFTAISVGAFAVCASFFADHKAKKAQEQLAELDFSKTNSLDNARTFSTNNSAGSFVAKYATSDVKEKGWHRSTN